MTFKSQQLLIRPYSHLKFSSRLSIMVYYIIAGYSIDLEALRRLFRDSFDEFDAADEEMGYPRDVRDLHGTYGLWRNQHKLKQVPKLSAE